MLQLNSSFVEINTRRICREIVVPLGQKDWGDVKCVRTNVTSVSRILQVSHEKTKKTRILSIESWLFNRDPYFIGLLRGGVQGEGFP